MLEKKKEGNEEMGEKFLKHLWQISIVSNSPEVDRSFFYYLEIKREIILADCRYIFFIYSFKKLY